MWADERAELRREIKETLITASEWILVWSGMMVLLFSII